MNLLRLTKYLLLINFKDFGFLFWTIAYPLVLVTIFMATTANLGSNELSDIDVGVDSQYEYTAVLEEIEFINVQEMTESNARTDLSDEAITGYISSDGSLLVEGSGFEQTVLESVLNQVHQTGTLGVSPENFNYETDFIQTTDMDTEPQVVMFYSTIAMISLYTMFTSMELISSMRPNLSTMGARFSASPFSKSLYILASSLASLVLGLFSSGIVIGFLMIFYQDNLFNNLPATLGIVLAANFAGLGLGYIIGLTPKVNINVKSIFPVVLIVGLAFLAGLMGPGLRGMINQQAPLINQLNPLAHITDSIYRVNLMGNFDGYWMTILYLVGITLVSALITLVALRRKQYDNI
ncbi:MULTISPECIES: ABC transporter permease [Jeotgalicoccus]|uniref:ABC transporter permease n=1 Tax=Jeotgalicoccus TaxID=227979 RepID=UPI00040B16CA|nr:MULTISPECIES: ABC transporter permease [Jeotgalicoccus]QQD84935.1 ABC transporter permease [Jeotgalicoccus sp. ATCC 8456]